MKNLFKALAQLVNNTWLKLKSSFNRFFKRTKPAHNVKTNFHVNGDGTVDVQLDLTDQSNLSSISFEAVTLGTETKTQLHVHQNGEITLELQVESVESWKDKAPQAFIAPDVSFEPALSSKTKAASYLDLIVPVGTLLSLQGLNSYFAEQNKNLPTFAKTSLDGVYLGMGLVSLYQTGQTLLNIWQHKKAQNVPSLVNLEAQTAVNHKVNNRA